MSLDVLATILGAIVVALITAVTTDRRLESQLHAEGERLNARLDHERYEADRADLRAVVDAAADAAVAAMRQAGTVSANVEEDPWAHKDPDEIERAIRTSINVLLNLLTDLTPHTARLTVRLTREHPATEAYWKLQEVGNVLSRGIPTGIPARAGEVDDVQRDVKLFSEQVRAFLNEANGLVGLRVD